MRTSSGGPEHGHDHEQPGEAGADHPDNWLAVEIQDGIERWDPGPGGFQRVLAARRKRIQTRRRNVAVAGLAVAACVLLVFTLAPPARSSVRAVASTVIGTLAGVETPPPAAGSPEPSSSPTRESGQTAVAETPPGSKQPTAVGAPTVTHTPTPVATPPSAPAPTPPPVESGANSPAPPASPSPTPASSPGPICILGLICLG